MADAVGADVRVYDGRGAGAIETVLNDAYRSCETSYILRLDDDELLDASAISWLQEGEYVTEPVWHWRRRHLWGDGWIGNWPLYPDLQIRLAHVRQLAQISRVHELPVASIGSPAGGHLYHHKFLVRDRADRQRLADRYEALQPGSGSAKFAVFQVPEDVLGPDMQIIPL
jgi:hypothetical protein